ncbi:MAG TPA: hypothetical protein VLM89_02525 [Phycisphaerae bacterium]|nr:hypothetical protein [Phycisphaerae bacterium]
MLLAALVAGPATRDVQAAASKAVAEAVEYVTKKFAAEVGEESAETLSAKLTRLSARHGDEAVTAFRKIGPRTFRAVEEAGEHADTAIKLLARHGDEALWVVQDTKRLTLVTRYGDDAAEAMIRHKGVASPLIEQFQEPAARALKAVDGQNARRVAMMTEDGTLAKIGHTDALLGVIERHGNRAADFIWRNKGGLAVGAALAAFLNDPQPFIDGTRELAGLATQPVAEMVRETARQSAERTNWTAVWITVLVIVGLLLVVRSRRARPAGQ